MSFPCLSYLILASTPALSLTDLTLFILSYSFTLLLPFFFFFFQAEDGIRDFHVTGVQTCALPICAARLRRRDAGQRRDHDPARLRLPPRVDDRCASAADVLLVPDPRLGVDRL